MATAELETFECTSPLSHPAFAAKFPNAAAEAVALSPKTSPRAKTGSTASSPRSYEGAVDVADHVGASAVAGRLTFAPPAQIDHVAVLREAVMVEDWGKAYSEGRAQCHAKASWCASAERCSIVQSLCSAHGAKRVLEVGSFCGALALALAEALPDDGAVVSLEYDPFFVAFGGHYRSKSILGSKIKTMTGPAFDSLATLAGEIKAGVREPFEAAVIDADKSNMQAYFDFLLESGIVTEQPLIFVDSTPFKGQIPARFQKFGMAEKVAPVDSGEQQIRDFARAIKARSDFIAHEFGGMMVVQRSRV